MDREVYYSEVVEVVVVGRQGGSGGREVVVVGRQGG